MEIGVVAGILLILALFALGAPVFVAIGLGSIAILELTDSPHLLSDLGVASFEGMNAFAFLSIPLFVLTGDIISRTGVATALLDLAGALVDHIRGGISTAVLLACGFFAAISGSSASDAAVLARLSIPGLVQRGYPRAYAAALIAAGGTTAVLIPPSIGFILIGYTLRLSVTDLFLATIVPGIVVLLVLMAINLVCVRWRGFEGAARESAFSWQALWRALVAARVGLLFPVIILGGIYTGVFTPTESAAVAVAVGLVHGFATRRLTLSGYCQALRGSAIVVGAIMPIVAVAYFFGQALSYFETQKAIVDSLLVLTDNRILIIVVMFLIVFVMGMFVDVVPNLLVLGPLLLPTAIQIGMDPLHFGVWFMFTLAIGLITPPYGVNLFVVCGVAGVAFEKVAREIAPFVLAMIIANVIVLLLPGMSLWVL